MKKVKCASLVIDASIHPRHNIDSHPIRCIKEAEEAGVEMPPIIADEKTRRVVDGVYRLKAKILRLGDDAEIDVIFQRFKSTAEMFLEAMRLNALHGTQLDTCDHTHCLIVAQRLEIDIQLVAGALHIPADRLGELRNTRLATAPKTGLSIPLKRTVARHFAGKTLTPRQVETNERSSGMNQSFYANQLIDLLEAKMLDLADEKLVERLSHLRELLDGVLTKRRRVAKAA